MKQEEIKLKGVPEPLDDNSITVESEKNKQVTNTFQGQEEKPKRRRRRKKIKEEDQNVKIGITLPKSLVKQLKLQAVKDDDTISGWVEKLLRRSIGKRTKEKVET